MDPDGARRRLQTGNQNLIRPMNSKLSLLTVVLALAASVHGATNDLHTLFQRGLLAEEGERNFDAAIASYQSVVAQFDKDREVAATAVFRLGECYRKLGRTDEAMAQYSRVLRDFADQESLVPLSRKNLSKPGGNASGAQTGSPGDSLGEQARLLREEIRVAEEELDSARKQARLNLVSQSDVRAKERDVLRLRRQLAGMAVDSEPGLSAETLRHLEQVRIEASAQHAKQKNLLTMLRSLRPDELRKALPTAVSDAQLNNLMSELDLAEQNFLRIRHDVGPDHPDYKNSERLVADLNRKIDDRVDGVLTGLKVQVDSLEAYVESLVKQIEEQKQADHEKLERARREGGF